MTKLSTKPYFDVYLDFDKFRNSSVLLTGTTGLIGGAILSFLIKNTNRYNTNYILLLRNKEQSRFFEEFVSVFENISFLVEGELRSLDNIDYVIHCAGVTQSEQMVKNPVDVIHANLMLTDKLLSMSLRAKVKSFLYVSTMEVYGSFASEVCVTEEQAGVINPLIARNSYPLSKKAAENLCFSYYSQYGVPIKIARPTLTFGAGVSLNDNRVFAQFARSVVLNKKIILHTKGQSKRDYLFIDDAVCGLIHVLLFGDNGSAYNLANPNTYMSIMDMAHLVCRLSSEYWGSDSQVEVCVDASHLRNSSIYAPDSKISLNIDKAIALGWKPKVGLKEMYSSLIDYYFKRI